jgi:hypothetical protein
MSRKTLCMAYTALSVLGIVLTVALAWAALSGH